jgi:cell division protein FtsB
MLKNLRLLIIVVILILIFLPGFAKVQELKARLRDAEENIIKTQRRNAELEETIAKMRNSPEYLEIVAREKMGVVKKGETVIKIVPSDMVLPQDHTTVTNATVTNSVQQ